MKHKTKWIEVSSPDQPVSDIAELALSTRLEWVWHYLPLAAKQSEEDIEYIHQLRVSSRRAVAALKMFQDVLSRKKYKAACRRLRDIRKAAGAARDDDVMLIRLAQETSSAPHSQSAELITELQHHRNQAQHAVVAAHKRSRRKKWKKANRHLIKRIAWRDESREPGFGDWAKRQLRPVVASFLEKSVQVPQGVGNLSDVKTLHALRIDGKRLRYSMELVAAVFPTSFRKDLYPLVEQLQERLGDLNDHATAQSRYQKWLDSSVDSSVTEESSVELTRRIQYEHDSVNDSVKAFHKWWGGPQSAALQEGLKQILAEDGERS